MLISVIVCTYNRSKILKRCIESIERSTISKEKYEIVIINNNSSDDTEIVAKNLQDTYGNIIYKIENKIGLSNARNRGLKEANGDIVIFLDDDTVVIEEYLEAVSNVFLENSNLMCAGGKIIPVWECQKPEWFKNSFAAIIGETTYGDENRSMKENEYPLGGNMIFRKEIFKKIGLFNTSLGIQGDKLYLGEEVELCKKVRELGNEIYYIANAAVYHTVHENKIDKNYISNRLKLEGESLAEIHIKDGKKMKGLIVRSGILCIRDIPLYIATLSDRSKNFEKKCKVDRSLSYIKRCLKK